MSSDSESIVPEIVDNAPPSLETGVPSPPPPSTGESNTTEPPEPTEPMITEDISALYWKIVFVVNIFFVICEVIGFNLLPTVTMFGTDWNWGVAIAFLHVFYTVASIVIIGHQWQASFVFLGRPLFDVFSGPHYVPAGICSLVRVSRLVEELELPGEPEKVWHGDEIQGQALPDGKVPPIRIPCRGSEEDRNDLLALRLTIEPSFVVRFRILSPTTFIVRVRDMDELRKQIQDIIVSACGPEFAKRTVALVLKEWHMINEHLDNAVNHVVSEWGVKVVNCQMKEAGIPHRTNSALTDLGVARSNSIATATRAEGEQKRLILEGEGRASAILSETKARTEGLSIQIKELQTLPLELARTALVTEAAPRTMREAKASVVLGNNTNDLMSSLVGASQAVNKIAETEEREERS